MSVMTVTDSTFDAEVLQSKLPVLVEFTKKNVGSAKDKDCAVIADVVGQQTKEQVADWIGQMLT
jgi:hypothetical protein